MSRFSAIETASAPLPKTNTRAEIKSVRLLDGLKLDYGPVDELASFLLEAEKAMSDLGITVYISPASELVRICKQNPDSWGWFSPILDVRIAPLDATNSYSITGRDQSGEIVVLQGGRLLDTGNKTLQEMADDQSLYYGAPRIPAVGELSCSLSAPIASTLKGRLHYSGGLWIKPSCRGRGFPAITERISRALALGWWGTSHAFSFVSESLASSPVMEAYGYGNIQPSYSIFKDNVEIYKGSVIWMTAEAVVGDLNKYRSASLAKVDRGVVDRSRKHRTVSSA